MIVCSVERPETGWGLVVGNPNNQTRSGLKNFEVRGANEVSNVKSHIKRRIAESFFFKLGQEHLFISLSL